MRNRCALFIRLFQRNADGEEYYDHYGGDDKNDAGYDSIFIKEIAVSHNRPDYISEIISYYSYTKTHVRLARKYCSTSGLELHKTFVKATLRMPTI